MLSPKPIDAICEGSRLQRLRIERRWLRVRHVLETWVIQGAWWHHEERRVYARVLADGTVVEVYRRTVERGSPTWFLARKVD